MATVDFNRIATNIAALNTLNSLRQINNKLSMAQTRLASGKRINEAADDPAGLSIATKLNARSESMKVALNNIGDAKNLLAVTEGGLSKMTDILIQIRSKSEQAASDTLGSAERSAIKQEIQSLAQQLQNIVDETKFNGSKLLDGTVNKRFQTGAENGEYTTFSLTQAHDPTTLGVSSKNASASASGFTASGTSFTTAAAASVFSGNSVLDTGGYTATVADKATSALIGKAIATSAMPTNIASLGTVQSTNASDELSYSATTSAASGGNFTVVVDSYTAVTNGAAGAISYTVKDSGGAALFSVANQVVGVAAGTGAIAVDIKRSAGGNSSGLQVNITAQEQGVASGSSVDFEYIARNNAKVQVTDASGAAVNVDTDGSNLTTGAGSTGPTGYYAVGGARDTGRGVTLTLGVFANVAAGHTAAFTYNEQGNFVVNVGTAQAASAYMSTIDSVIDTVNKSMAALGALTARMSVKEETLSTAQVNTEAAWSRIMNADMASEQVNATKYGILQQTALAMLSRANTDPQAILSLFR